MWMMTKIGFFSIVQVRGGVGYYIRAREKKDLENVKAMGIIASGIGEDPTADYRYRMIASRDELDTFMLNMAGEIDYPNFKNAVKEHPDQEKKVIPYHEIWAILASHLSEARRYLWDYDDLEVTDGPEICENCNGYGHTRGSRGEKEKCWMCLGAGSLNGDVSEICPVCHGEGTDENKEECQACGGTGIK